MQKITPCLWFDGKAEEATHFYLSVFPRSRMRSVLRGGEGGPVPKGSVLMTGFVLDGQEFLALNGGPQYRFTPAISLSVDCKTQKEVDHYWEKLTSDGGKPVQCGWLTDKYGISWQIVPTVLPKMLRDKNPEKAKRAFQAMLTMVKLDIAALKKAYAGK